MKVEFAEGGKPEYPEKKPRSQIEIDKSQPKGRPRIGSQVVKVGGATDDHYGNLTHQKDARQPI